MEPTTALVPIGKTALARPLEFTAEQTQLIRDTFANGASDGDFAVLMEIAKARNLNPLLRQVWFVQRWDGAKKRMVWAVQVSIDGLRTIAQRTGLYDGQDEPEFIYDGKRMVLARVKVYRKDWARPAVGVAHFDEYVMKTKEGNVTSMWRDKPHIMIAKCAEALGLRKAFPEDTAGLYVPEEMPDKGDEDSAPSQRPQRRANVPTTPQAGPPPAAASSGSPPESDEQVKTRWKKALAATETVAALKEVGKRISDERGLTDDVRLELSNFYAEHQRALKADKPKPGPCSVCGDKEHAGINCKNATPEERAEMLRTDVTKGAA